MNLIKLNAISSTNDFLKDAIKAANLDNHTVIWAAIQTAGKGQHGASWMSEADKNMTISLLEKNGNAFDHHLFHWNRLVAYSLYLTLQTYNVPNLSIKWPNDIMSGNQKLSGILIEISRMGAEVNHLVIGVGLNVNQTQFDDLPHATSLQCVLGQELSVETIIKDFVKQYQNCYKKYVENNTITALVQDYEAVLYQKGIWAFYKNASGELFEALFKTVTADGLALLVLKDGTEKTFEIKSFQFVR